MRKPRIQNQRGSALVLVTLLTLILAAIAIIALRNTARGVQQTATYQTRLQAGESSTSLARITSRRVGDQAPKYWQRMTSVLSGSNTDDGNVLGASGSGTGTMSEREDAILIGPYISMDNADIARMLGSTGTETGLFIDGTAVTDSFEAKKPTELRFVIRDPIESNAASGFGLGQSFCFKKVVMYSEAVSGTADDDWKGANNIAQVRGGLEGLIGPIECSN